MHWNVIREELCSQPEPPNILNVSSETQELLERVFWSQGKLWGVGVIRLQSSEVLVPASRGDNSLT